MSSGSIKRCEKKLPVPSLITRLAEKNLQLIRKAALAALYKMGATKHDSSRGNIIVETVSGRTLHVNCGIASVTVHSSIK